MAVSIGMDGLEDYWAIVDWRKCRLIKTWVPDRVVSCVVVIGILNHP